MSVENIINEIRRQRFLFHMDDANARQKAADSIVFFPRKKLKMKKMGDKNFSRAYFISERTDKTATRLEKPTEANYEALASGLRSAIIKESSGKYIKLKGVAPRLNLSQKGWRGLCSKEEVFCEHLFCHSLGELEFPFLPITPSFVEPANIPSKIAGLEGVVTFASSGHKNALTHSESFEEIFNEYQNFFEAFPSNSFCFVSAFEIEGDTRLDEAIYHLTKNPLRGNKKKMRDSILHYLSFFAGFSKAALMTEDFSWGNNFDNTNAHIGNFVVYPQDNVVDVGITDLNGMKVSHTFDSRADFIKHTEKELACFKDNLFEETACSFPTYLRYKHFSGRLRQECFDAMRTGYLTFLGWHTLETKLIFPSRKHKNLLFPEKFYIPENQFNKDCEEIMN
ncbi:MAG: hypothetical protein V1886_00145 [archaeon]